MYYIMEYCDKGTLFDYLTQYPFGIIEENTKEIFKQIIAALGYLHSKGYAHGDIRLENFVRTNETFIKIIDFGFLKKIDVKSNEFHGSNYYMAPEILNHEEYLPVAPIHKELPDRHIPHKSLVVHAVIHEHENGRAPADRQELLLTLYEFLERVFVIVSENEEVWNELLIVPISFLGSRHGDTSWQVFLVP